MERFKFTNVGEASDHIVDVNKMIIYPICMTGLRELN